MEDPICSLVLSHGSLFTITASTVMLARLLPVGDRM